MLPPHELRGKEFSHSLRGYNTAEVDEHIDFLLEKYTDLYRHCDEVERELQATKDRLASLEENSDAIRRAMIHAQREEEKMITEAQARADLITRTAKENCDRTLVEFRRKVHEERVTLHRLRASVDALRENALRQFQLSLHYIEEIAPRREGEPEWEKTEEDYASELLEQMKLDIAAAADRAYSVRESGEEQGDHRESPPTDSPEEEAPSSGKKGARRKARGKEKRKGLTEADVRIPAGALDNPDTLDATIDSLRAILDEKEKAAHSDEDAAKTTSHEPPPTPDPSPAEPPSEPPVEAPENPPADSATDPSAPPSDPAAASAAAPNAASASNPAPSAPAPTGDTASPDPGGDTPAV